MPAYVKRRHAPEKPTSRENSVELCGKLSNEMLADDVYGNRGADKRLEKPSR
jgi:hypothetical protein